MGGMGGGNGMFETMVPGHKVGLIIGKGGETIKQLQERSGAKIIIIQDSPEAAHEKPLRITGDPNAVETAKELVNEILNQNDDRDMGGFGGPGGPGGRGRGRGAPRGGGRGGFMGRGGPGGPRGGGRGGFGGGWGGPGGNEYGSEVTDYVTIPSNKCGLVIGKGGETIKTINSSTGAHCEVDKNALPDAREKNFIIRGSPEAVERAKGMIMEKIGMPVTASTYGNYGGTSGGSSWGGSSGGYPAAGGFSDGGGVAPSSGQADYSAQWADYYRSIGMIREAEAIEAQMRVILIFYLISCSHQKKKPIYRVVAQAKPLPQQQQRPQELLQEEPKLQLQGRQALPMEQPTVRWPIIQQHGLTITDLLAK